ncbi:hypothetical protein TVAG_131890 [Trichomonas vaginalis G3]|uniref:Uncharacterized protein n=1 Tax=Trichomonas vaginalis (strain ATCC PRA-98 / G3) TaxID=412133 RepID=A2FMG8_TRIV3|nr:SHIPPO-1-related family [Trichomonas vaginalis G3]EAX93901.1 hypothetical protein TVAG_131890 [Trichomonas vaginalis G3]KAI5534326.1 SHIPPO-1-related family [Trichomonas vaginalis G3]|eukprot:XP_001306831.1 hypothetical protein [Trichomonas vaginalis G3]
MTFCDFCRGRKEVVHTEPGLYNIPSTIGSGPKYSMKSRHEEPKPQYSPKYNQLPSTLSSKGVRLQSKDTVGFSRSLGAYDNSSPQLVNLPSTIGQGPKIAIHEKHKEKHDHTPGPGSYDPKIIDKSPAYPIGVGKRYDISDGNMIVPPGTYDIPSTIKARPATQQTNRKQTRRTKFQKKQHPGPIYNVERPIGSDARKSSFSKAPRDFPIPQSPGPGDYDIPSEFGFSGKNLSRIRTTMHIRPKESKSHTTNAPYYDIGTTIKPRPKSMAHRPEVNYETPSPGPCYDIPSSISPRKISIGQKYEFKDPRAENPSPDAYFRSDMPVDESEDVVSPLDGPYNRDIINYREISSLPGPADYNIKDGKDLASSRKGSKIKNRSYDSRDIPDTAVPYRDLGSTLGGPAYTIGIRDF